MRNSGTIQIMKKFVRFLWDCKMWWLIPMLVMVALFALLLTASSETGDAPFIYQLF